MEKIFDIAKNSEQSWGTLATAIDGNLEYLSNLLGEDTGSFLLKWDGEGTAILVTDGTLISAINRNRTELTSVEHVEKVIIGGSSSPKYYVVYYDEQGKWVSSDGWNTAPSYDISSKKPANASFFRMLIDTTLTNTEDVEIAKSAYGILLDVNNIKKRVSSLENKPFIVVDSKGRGDYTTIEDALKNAADSESNPVTIFVMPGIYYPAPKIGTDNKPYEEANRYISLIGMDKNSCILKGDVGYYYWQNNIDYSLIRLNGNILIKNFTFDARSDKYIETATQNGWDLTSPHCRGYCVHADGGREENTIIEINNCNMYNDHFACFGFGVRPDSPLKIIDCELISDVDSATNQLGGFSSFGTVYGHLLVGSNLPNQNIDIIRCQIINTNYPQAINLMGDYVEGAQGTVKCIHNACKTTNTKASYVAVDSFVLDELSSGNNIPSMNITLA